VTCFYLHFGVRLLSIDMMGWKGDNKFIKEVMGLFGLGIGL
jgi:hypothetical protein